jgi:hypothetical protein
MRRHEAKRMFETLLKELQDEKNYTRGWETKAKQTIQHYFGEKSKFYQDFQRFTFEDRHSTLSNQVSYVNNYLINCLQYIVAVKPWEYKADAVKTIGYEALVTFLLALAGSAYAFGIWQQKNTLEHEKVLQELSLRECSKERLLLVTKSDSLYNLVERIANEQDAAGKKNH